ncbi:hypothetical protein NEDG_01526 [Nematocida displodere]|uniref:U3 small nucleolar RNA-associated protein 4 n=1 Tax=Nematocida displodere TaxID=1805483 RepID=A0A177EG55_9MICR|nr:hypothetical protein NEDG_01526 [Nematocida displodere]
MRLHMCRRDSVLPQSIVAMGVNEKYVGVVMESGVVEIYDMLGLRQVLRLDIGMRDVQTAAFDGEDFLIGSLSEGLGRVSLKTLSVKRAPESGLWSIQTKSGKVFTIYSVEQGGSELRLNNKLFFVSRAAVFAGCFGKDAEEVAFGTEQGRFVIVRGGKVLFDLLLPPVSASLSLTITAVCRAVGSEYAVATRTGEVYIVDSAGGGIKQIIQAKKSSINAVCATGDRIFVTGADSRILAYSRTLSGEYTKHSQNDTHVADVFCMATVNESIVTAGTDGVINVHIIPQVGQMQNTRRYPSVEVAQAPDGKLFVCSGNDMKVLEMGLAPQAPNHKPVATYKTIFRHTMKHPVLSVQCASNIAVVRTKEGIRAYRYNWATSEVAIVKEVLGFAVFHTLIGRDIWCVIDRKGDAAIVRSSLDTGAESTWYASKLGLGFLPVSITGIDAERVFVFGEGGAVLNLGTGKAAAVLFDGEARTAACVGDELVICAMKASQDVSVLSQTSLVHRYSLSKKKVTDTKETKANSVIEMLCTQEAVILITQKRIALLPGDATKPVVYTALGAVVDGGFLYNGEVVCVQGPWGFTRQVFPLQVHKEKYGRR